MFFWKESLISKAFCTYLLEEIELKKKKHRLLVFIILVILVTAGISFKGLCKNIDESRIQAGIAEQIIRFHVRANSDSENDQALKLKVKDQVVTYIKPLLGESSSIEQSRNILNEHMDEIKNVALNTLKEAGSGYDVKVYFEESYFPMKTYGDVCFPPGNYEAFRIDIGEAEGKNWWCVLYPPLCFVDTSCGVLPDDSKQTLKNILTDDEYNAITESCHEYKYRFKYLTFLNDLFN